MHTHRHRGLELPMTLRLNVAGGAIPSCWSTMKNLGFFNCTQHGANREAVPFGSQ